MNNFRHLVHRLSDPDQFGVALSGARLTADFLSPQKQPTFVEQFQAPGWSLDFHEAHVKARLFAPLPEGWISLGLMCGTSASSWYGIPAQQGTLACNPPGEPIDGCITPGFTCVSLNVPVATWEKCRLLAGGGDGIRRFNAFHLPQTVYHEAERNLREIRLSLQAAGDSPHAASFAAARAEEFAVEMATTAWELSCHTQQPRDSYRNRARLARQAENWMRGHLAEHVKIPDICLALGVSRRELEYAFRTVFDQSPRDFLQSLRLNAIRGALRNTDVPVIHIALDHGVTHLGRFAAHYRKLFGEPPGRTSRKVCR